MYLDGYVFMLDLDGLLFDVRKYVRWSLSVYWVFLYKKN